MLRINSISAIGRSLYLIFLISLSKNAVALDWTQEMLVNVETGYNDNILLIDESDEDANVLDTTSRIITGKYTLNGSSKKFSFSIIPKFQGAFYSDQKQLSSDNQFMDVNYQYYGERSLMSVRVHWVRDTTLTSELADSGLVSTNRRRKSASSEVTWTHSISELTKINITGNVDKVMFDDAGNTGLVDYNEKVANLVFVQSINEISSMRVGLYQSTLKVEEFRNRTENKGFNLTVESNYLKAHSGYLRYGQYESTISVDSGNDIADIEKQNTGRTYKFEYNFSNEKSSFTISLLEDLRPSSLGVLVTNDQLNLSFTRNFSTLRSIHATYLGSLKKELHEQGKFDDWEYQSADIRYSYNWNKYFQVAALYRRAKSNFPEKSNNAESNSIFFIIDIKTKL